MQHEMRILLWSPHGAGEHYGGPGTSALRLYAHPAAEDLQVTLAHGYCAQADHPEVFAARHFIAPSVKDVMVRVGGMHVPRPGRTIRHAMFLRAARDFIREHAAEFDVFHGLMAYDQTVVPAYEAERAGLPAVVKVAQHGAEIAIKGAVSRMLGRVQRRRKLLSRLHGVIAITSAIADELIAAGVPESSIARIPNGVDTRRFRPPADRSEVARLRAHLGWPDLPTVLFVGGVIERKRPHLIVEAVRRLLRTGVESQLVMVGPASDPDYAAALKQVVATHDLGNHVIWSDFRPDVELCYRAADLFCLPSRAEGLSNATLEAMASGLPVVMTKVSGAAETSAGEVSGIVVEEATAPAITEALRFYLDDATARSEHGEAARRKAVNHFSSSRVLELHKQLFRHMLKGGVPAEVAPL